MDTPAWREPPEGDWRAKTAEEGLRWEAEAGELRAAPGRSLLLDSYPLGKRESAKQLAYAIRIGRYPAFRLDRGEPGRFGARSATEKNERGEKVVNVYAWYDVGDAG